jgi:hypothetical protein
LRLIFVESKTLPLSSDILTVATAPAHSFSIDTFRDSLDKDMSELELDFVAFPQTFPAKSHS